MGSTLSNQECKEEKSTTNLSKGESKGEGKGESSLTDPSKGESNRSKLIALISRNGNITLPEVASSLNLSLGGVEKIVRQLKAEGIISRKGSTKAGEWIIHILEN